MAGPPDAGWRMSSWCGAPLGVGAILLALTLVALGGAFRVRFSDEYQEIFRTDHADFALLEEVADQFGGDENEVVVLLLGPDVLTRDGVAVLEGLSEGLASIPGLVTVDSPTTVSRLPALAAGAEDAADRAAARAAVAGHPLLMGRLIADGFGAALLAVRLDHGLRRLEDAQPVLAAIDDLLGAATTPGWTIERTGLPYVRSETVRSLQRDQWLFTTVGVLLGSLIAVAGFRDPRLALVTAVGPLVATIWTVGAMGLLGEPLNVMNNVTPVLVMVIGMTDSVHFVREFQRLRGGAGEAWMAQRQAALEAVRRVAVPCTLTSVTTMLGFASLALADVAIVRRFGVVCAAGIGLSLVSVLLLGPLLAGWTALGRAPSGRYLPVPTAWLGFLSASRRHSPEIALASLVLIGCSIASVGWLAPDYRYRDYLPAGSAALRGLAAVESAFGGSFAVRAVVDWPEGAAEAEVLGVLDEVERAMAGGSIFGPPFSVLTPLRAVAGRATPVADLPSPAQIPAPLRDRFWRPERRRALVEARAPGLGAAALEPHFRSLEAAFVEVAQRHRGFAIRLNGLLPVSARTSLRMIGSLATSLAVAALLIAVTLCLAMRSVKLGLVSVVPNLLPLGAICLFLAASGRPLQFTTVSVLSIVLGLAVDDTIHMVAGFRRARRAGADVERAAAETVESVGGSLLLTTALLVSGFAAVGLSRAPLMSLFGGLASAALIVALVADLVVLPAWLRIVFATPDRPVDPQVEA